MNNATKICLISLLCATSLSAESSSPKDSYKKKEVIKKHSVAAEVDGSPSAVKTPSTDQQTKNTEGLRKLEEKLRIEKKQKDATRLKAPSKKPRIDLDTGLENGTPLGNVPFKTKADKEREAAATRSGSPKNDEGEALSDSLTSVRTSESDKEVKNMVDVEDLDDGYSTIGLPSNFIKNLQSKENKTEEEIELLKFSFPYIVKRNPRSTNPIEIDTYTPSHFEAVKRFALDKLQQYKDKSSSLYKSVTPERIRAWAILSDAPTEAAYFLLAPQAFLNNLLQKQPTDEHAELAKLIIPYTHIRLDASIDYKPSDFNAVLEYLLEKKKLLQPISEKNKSLAAKELEDILKITKKKPSVTDGNSTTSYYPRSSISSGRKTDIFRSAIRISGNSKFILAPSEFIYQLRDNLVTSTEAEKALFQVIFPIDPENFRDSDYQPTLIKSNDYNAFLAIALMQMKKMREEESDFDMIPDIEETTQTSEAQKPREGYSESSLPASAGPSWYKPWTWRLPNPSGN